MAIHDIIINFFVCIGMFAVFACFGFLMPFWGQFLASIFLTVVGERTLAKAKGIPSGTEMED